MHFKFFHTLEKDLEHEFRALMVSGISAVGDKVEIGFASDFSGKPESDVALFWGVNGPTREIIDVYRAVGKRTLVFDKGAIRTRNRSDYNKVFLDGGTALAYLMRVDRLSDRWEKLGISLKPFKKSSGHIIYANNSQKVHDYWRLGSADQMAESIIGKLKRIAPTREVVFRPKPRALDFREIEGVRLSLRPDTIEDALDGAHCLVTYTSHCSINALIAGVPVICLGPNPGRPLAGKYLEQALQPHTPGDRERWQFFCNLAYAQWTDEEIRNGAVWEFLKSEMRATMPQNGEPLKPKKEGVMQ
jgi:hypothetical protein